jgi:hypothetical protein
MNLLSALIQAADQLVDNSAGPLEAIGLRMFLSLLTIMVVWMGVEEALYSAQGAPGPNIAKAIEFVLMASIGFAMIQFYEAPIPGVGFGFKDLVIKETTYLSSVIGNDGLNQINTAINDLQAQLGSGFIASSLNLYYTLVHFAIQCLLAVLSAVSIAVVGYGIVAASVCALLGPIFIPFFIVPRLNFLFWGWFRAFLGFSFYKVVAAAVLHLLGHLYLLYLTALQPINASDLAVKLPVLIVLIGLNIYILFKVPSITGAILSGHSHGAGFSPLSLLAFLK